MQRPPRAFANTFLSRVFLLAMLASPALVAQETGEPASGRSHVSLAVTYAAVHGNNTQLNKLWLNGGSAELTATLLHGWGATANVVGLHTGNAGNGVPLSFIATTLGPSFEHPATHGTHAPLLFVHALAGKANGFDGLYPSASGPIGSSNSLAVNVGGGADLAVAHRLAIRLFEVGWLRTQLPNAAGSAQNNLSLGAGIVLHLSPTR
jgi:hypothetical protein